MLRSEMDKARDGMMMEGFKQSFGAMDLLFFALAIFTAFQLAGRVSEKPTRGDDATHGGDSWAA